MLATIINSIFVALVTNAVVYSLAFVVGFILIRNDNVSGLYDCTYTVDHKDRTDRDHEVKELIFVFRFGWQYLGFMINTPGRKNPKRDQPRPVRRLRGKLSNGTYLGYWYDPKKHSKWIGTFNMLIDVNGSEHRGRWSGKNSKGIVSGGEWTWKRVEDEGEKAPYSMLALGVHLISKKKYSEFCSSAKLDGGKNS